MKLMQRGYNEIQSIEIELMILEQTSAPPSRPRKSIIINNHSLSNDDLKKPETDDTSTIVKIKRVRFVDETYET